jgi:fatty-acyl-CoA synthase
MSNERFDSLPKHFQHWPPGVPHQIPVVERTLWENLESTVQRAADHTALCFLGQQISYRELKRQAESLCGWLQQRAGVQRGDRVIVMMQNCPQFVIACYAVLRAGAAVVPVNPMTRAAEFPHYVIDPGAKVALCTADVAAEIFQAQQDLEPDQQLAAVVVTRYRDVGNQIGGDSLVVPESWTRWLAADPELPDFATRWTAAMDAALAPQPDCGLPDDLVTLGYTSGTTGKPKGCMHTHRTFGHNVVAGPMWAGATGHDISLAVAPMFHVTGLLYGVHAPIYLGSTSVIMPRWDRELAGALISQHRVTSWVNIPTMVIDLLASPNFKQFDLSSLRDIGGGGAAMPAAIAERLEDQYGLVYREGYGLTETAAPTHSNPPHRAKRQCLGVPIIGTEAKVIDPETHREMPPGETGEIVLRGPQVFKGYWNNPEATAAAFIEIDGKSFFRSGDLGHIDEDGYFFITDRLKRMINASGFKVWPAEVESMLYQHPDIQEVCVISSRDPYRGETVKAVVVPRREVADTITAEQIMDWARQKMAVYKVPRVVQFVASLPKSGSGKVMWRQLQEQESGVS